VPEGHTIHRLARDHKRLLHRQRVSATSPQGRFAEGAALIDGQVLTGTDAYGKHLFHRYGADTWLHVHLGLYGAFTRGTLPAPQPRGALRLRLEGGTSWLDLRGPTACEVVGPAEKKGIEVRLGPDPLRRDADGTEAWRRVSRSRVAVAALFMDQSVLAGVGNVYRAEILFRHRIPPHLPGRELAAPTWRAAWADLVDLMRSGVRTGRIVTTAREDRERISGTARQEDAHYVYRRAGLPCRLCGTEIRTEVLVGRNLFWCPRCQG